MRNPNVLFELIEAAFHRNEYRPFIDHLRFPYFKKFVPDTKIQFSFPITAFVGPNGCGKSSALQALYGCPEGKSLSDFWFSTSMDPIEEGADGNRNRMIYGYINAEGEAVEVLKQRNARGGNLDYWETQRSSTTLNMPVPSGGRERSEPIRKQVTYIDFRGLISSFSRFQLFGELNLAKYRTKQDFLRDQSRYVEHAFASTTETVRYRRKRSNGAIALNNGELEIINEILGKNFSQGSIVEHNFFGSWGYSAKFEVTGERYYTEAVSGSGEFAVVLMVHQLLRAPAHSLVLLDEPEISLHPSAQYKIINFLLELAVRKKHQIVFTTHSPELISCLPNKAIRLFVPGGNSRFMVESDVSPALVFHYIGNMRKDRVTVIVEDVLAAEILETILKRMPDPIRGAVFIRPGSGGAEQLNLDASHYSREGRKDVHIYLDGDKRPASDSWSMVPDSLNHDLAAAAVQVENALLLATNNQGGLIPRDGGTGGRRNDQFVARGVTLLNFLKDFRSFFPFNTPEEALWDLPSAKRLLLGLSAEEADRVIGEITAMNPKARFAALAQKIYTDPRAPEILSLQNIFIKVWMENNPDQVIELQTALEKIGRDFLGVSQSVS